MSFSHLHLEGTGEESRALAIRLSDLSLVALEEIARGLRRSHKAASDDSVAGLDLSAVRVALRDVSGSLWLADIMARYREIGEQTEGQSDRDDLLAGILQNWSTERVDDVETLIGLTLERYPADSLVRLTVGFVRWAQGNFVEASQLFAHASTYALGDEVKAHALFLQAMVAGDRDDFDAAISVLDLVAELEGHTTAPSPFAGRARYEQARLFGRHLGENPSPEQAERWQNAVREAVDADGFFFGPAFVDPLINTLEGIRQELRDRFNSISIDANLLANAGDAFVRELQTNRVVDYDALRPARETFRLRGYLSRSVLGARAIETVVQLRDAAAALLAERISTATETRDGEVSRAEAGRERGVQAAVQQLADGESKTRALDIQAFALRQTMSGRFRLDIPLDRQHQVLADELRKAKSNALIFSLACGLILGAVGAILVPTWVGKAVSVLVFAGAATGLVLWSRRRYRADITALMNELQRAQDVLSLEQNMAATAQQSQMQSQQTRAQAEGSRQAAVQKAHHDFESERAAISNAIAVLEKANRRFFHGIDGEDHPRAAFEPPSF